MKKLLYSISLLATLCFVNNKVKATENTSNIISTFEISTMKITDDEMLCWTSTNENGSLTYYVEQYIFNRWVEVAHVDGAGKPEATSYAVQLCLNSGENKLRLKQKGADKKSRFSKVYSFFSNKKPIVYAANKDKKSINFSESTYFMAYDPYGKIITQGVGISICTEEFNSGSYCIIFDNKLSEYDAKKKPTSASNRKPKKHRGVRNPYSRYKIG